MSPVARDVIVFGANRWRLSETIADRRLSLQSVKTQRPANARSLWWFSHASTHTSRPSRNASDELTIRGSSEKVGA